MAELQEIRRRHINLMHKTAEILGHLLRGVTQEQAVILRDGPEGWTVLEVLCHLRDFDTIFRQRAQMMVDQQQPALPAYDHEAMVLEKQYAAEDLAYVYDEFRLSRQQTCAFFEALTTEQWERAGIHPERGHFSMTDAVIQVGHHDIDHIEQIARILDNAQPDMLPIESYDDEHDEADEE
jgi:DinB superfamily